MKIIRIDRSDYFPKSVNLEEMNLPKLLKKEVNIFLSLRAKNH